MADAILLHLEYDEGGAREKVIELRVELQKLKKEQAELNRTYKEGIINEVGYARESQRIKEEASKLTKELRSQEKALDQNKTVSQAATGSLKQMRAELSEMKKAYAELSSEERDNSKAGQDQLKSIAELNEKLKGLEQAYGDHQRDVGNYQKAMQGAEKTAGAFGISLDGIKSNLETVKSGLEGTKLGLTGIKAAIASTGVGLLILALGSLVTFLTKTQTGMDFIERKTKAVSKVLGFLTDTVAKVGEGIFNAITGPGDAIEKLGNLIKENLTNRFEAFKVIVDAVSEVDMRKLLDGFLQLFTGVTGVTGKVEGLANGMAAAAAEGERIAAVSQRIREEERALNIERAISQKELAKLNLLSDDATKPIEARIEAAKKSGDIEIALLNKSLALQKLKLQNTKDDADANVEGLDAIAEEREKLAKLEEDSFNKQTAITKKINSLVLEGMRLRAQALVDEQQRILELAEDDRKYITDSVEEQRKADEEILKMRESLIKKQGDLELVGLIENSEQRKLVEAKTNLEIYKLRTEFAREMERRLLRVDQDRIEAKLSLTRRGSEEELILQKQLIDKQAESDAYEAGLQIKNKEELEAKISLIEAKARRDKRELDRQFNQQFFDQTVEMAQATTTAVGNLFAAQINIATNALNKQQEAALKGAGTNAELRAAIEEDFQKKRQKLEDEAAEKRKRVARAEAIINTAVGATKALATEGFLGILTGALIAAAGVAQLAVIDSQEFAEGGIYELPKDGPLVRGVGGPKSDNINARLSPGESVINAKSTAAFAPFLSWINEWGGGKSFSTGPSQLTVPLPQSIMHYAGGGIAPNVAVPEIDYNQLAWAMSRLPAPIVSVQDINSKQSEVAVREASNDH